MHCVVLIGPADDTELQSVARSLQARSCTVGILNSHSWPGNARLTLTLGRDRVTGRLEDIDLENIHSVFVRNLSLSPLEDRFESALKRAPYAFLHQLKEYRALILACLHRLHRSGTRIVNPPATLDHGNKAWQLLRFRDCGIPVPDSLLTSCPESLAAFARRHPAVIYKPIAGGGYARPLRPEDQTAPKCRRLANAPVLFQENVRGENWRLYVLDGKVIAAGKILSDRLDYRTGRHDVHLAEAPAELAASAIAATQALGLVFAGVDGIVHESRHVILEANASPMFTGFDRLAGANVGQTLAAYLTGC